MYLIDYNRKGTILLIFILLVGFSKASGYGVLTHEAVIDAAWDSAIIPLLKKKFPHATAVEFEKAHGYAYGGAIMPDMGYYPFGNILFTELVHYVRSGDFVMNLLSEAQDLNEFAFALGALAHYASDRDGHPGAVNLSVGMVYPKDKIEFGDTITYVEDPVAHRRMEFGFDVVQVANGKYAPKSYHDFIGFEVAERSLKCAFLLTYGLELKDLYPDIPLAINTFRWSVKTFLPEVTNAAWISNRKAIEKSQPGITRRKFSYDINRSQFHKEWGKNYHKPGAGTFMVAVVIKILPKIGLARILKFKPPLKAAEQLFLKSFNHSVSDYSVMQKKYQTGTLQLDNIDFDTGKKIVPCEYILVDDTYKQLLLQLPSHPVEQVDKNLRQDILDFYKIFMPNAKSNEEAKKCSEAIEWLQSVE
jgi:hypothetical protein